MKDFREPFQIGQRMNKERMDCVSEDGMALLSAILATPFVPADWLHKLNMSSLLSHTTAGFRLFFGA